MLSDRFPGGGWGMLAAVLLVVLLLALALLAGGRRRDSGQGRWPIWLMGALAVAGVVFLLSRAVSGLTYQGCGSYVACR